MKVIQSQIPEENGKPKYQKKMKSKSYDPEDSEDEEDDDDEEGEEPEEEKERYIRLMITIKDAGVTMPLYSLDSIEKDERFVDRPKAHFEFGIVINRGMLPSVRCPRVDVEIWYNTVEKRDERLAEIIENLEKEGVKVIGL